MNAPHTPSVCVWRPDAAPLAASDALPAWPPRRRRAAAARRRTQHKDPSQKAIPANTWGMLLTCEGGRDKRAVDEARVLFEEVRARRRAHEPSEPAERAHR